jgi:predicted transcriptional regulator
VSTLPGVSKRILAYLDKILQEGGRASRMDFLRIAGNESNLNDWVEYLVLCNLIREEASQEQEGKVKTTYVVTDHGKKVHEVIKDYGYLGPLFGDLSRQRRRPR